MLVKNWMNKKVITIDAKESMLHAINLIKKNQIHMLPVTEESKLVGVVTDRDLKHASASKATALEIHELFYLIDTVEVKEIMTQNVVTVPFDFTLEETAEVLLEKKISGAPVLDHGGQIVGIITKTDIFNLLTVMTGVGRRGIQFAFRLEDRPGSIKDITDIIRECGGRMASILTTYQNIPTGYRNVYIHTYEIDQKKLSGLKDVLEKEATLLYMVDHTGGKREIY